ncbi:hypothetical protein HELRODRAFT_182984 [Helobdella robusta]|uniref:Uncharacterized protein n=1 Tax=Helobdella robusta TaxID=6412 RepID=T1FJ17_HELRO|nr:hypothetical protein HELRODRAFT_182984 [Helobdella robusta]ESN89974.1 hypothetical protein HELRODRAFT_182984 [Helobdella robusta]
MPLKKVLYLRIQIQTAAAETSLPLYLATPNTWNALKSQAPHTVKALPEASFMNSTLIKFNSSSSPEKPSLTYELCDYAFVSSVSFRVSNVKLSSVVVNDEAFVGSVGNGNWKHWQKSVETLAEIGRKIGGNRRKNCRESVEKLSGIGGKIGGNRLISDYQKYNLYLPDMMAYAAQVWDCVPAQRLSLGFGLEDRQMDALVSHCPTVDGMLGIQCWEEF